MTYLLDVNVLIALLDKDHVFHDLAQRWFAEKGGASWATCPLTENGAIRILGHARYPQGPGSPAAAATLMEGLRDHEGHVLWEDQISLFTTPHVRLELVGVAAQITDTYLLALAVQRGGRLATLDKRLSAAPVEGGSEALVFLE